jgi:chemotaxis protein histidine kinase CheA
MSDDNNANPQEPTERDAEGGTAESEPEQDEAKAAEVELVEEPERDEAPSAEETESAEETGQAETQAAEEPELAETQAAEEPEQAETQAAEEPEQAETQAAEEPEQAEKTAPTDAVSAEERERAVAARDEDAEPAAEAPAPNGAERAETAPPEPVELAERQLGTVHFDAEGRSMVVLDGEGGLTLNDLAPTHARYEMVFSDLGRVVTAVLSADGRVLVAADETGRVAAEWLPEPGYAARQEILDPVVFSVGSPPNRLALHPQGELLAVGFHEQPAVSLYDLRTGDWLGGFHLHDGPSALTFSPSGRSLAYVDGTSTLVVWSLVDGGRPARQLVTDLERDLPRRLLDVLDPPVLGLHVNGRGALIVWSDGRLDWLTAQERATSWLNTPVERPMADMLARVARLDVPVERGLREALLAEDPKGELVAAAFSPGGRYLAVAQDDGALVVWGLERPGLLSVDWQGRAPRRPAAVALPASGELMVIAAGPPTLLGRQPLEGLNDGAPKAPAIHQLGRAGWSGPSPEEPPEKLVGELLPLYRQLDLERRNRSDTLSDLENQLLRKRLLPRLAAGFLLAARCAKLNQLERMIGAFEDDDGDGDDDLMFRLRETAQTLGDLAGDAFDLSDQELWLLGRGLGLETSRDFFALVQSLAHEPPD